MTEFINNLLPNVSNIWDVVWESLGETLYMVGISGAIAGVLGVILGVILLITDEGGLIPNALLYNI